MKIGIYNRYWSTAGGGEKHVGSLLDEIFEKEELDLISTEDFDLDSLRQRLSLKLRNVNKVIWPNIPDASLSPWTCEYDLLINATYRSYLHSLAKKSIYFAFFPHQLHGLASSTRARGALVIEGSYGEENDGLLWTFPTTKIKFRSFRRSITIPLRSVNRTLTNTNKICILTKGCRLDAVTIDEICISSVKPYLSSIQIAVPKFVPGQVDLRCLGLPLDLDQLRKRNGFKNIRIDPSYTNGDHFLSSYDLFIANSNYTKEWINRRWEVRSVVVRPKIDPPLFTEKRKKNTIISVGRFFAEKDGSHNKKQHVLIEAFKRMCDNCGHDLGWRLVLAGAFGGNKEDEGYLNNLESQSRGYPIDFFLNVERRNLMELYNESSIFWQATGFEESTEEPEKFEHFGITTCEAMSYGCIPIVYDAAGQKEIVNDLSIGYRFGDMDELVERTLHVISRIEIGDLDCWSEKIRDCSKKYESFDSVSLKQVKEFVCRDE